MALRRHGNGTVNLLWEESDPSPEKNKSNMSFYYSLATLYEVDMLPTFQYLFKCPLWFSSYLVKILCLCSLLQFVVISFFGLYHILVPFFVIVLLTNNFCYHIKYLFSYVIIIFIILHYNFKFNNCCYNLILL